MFSFTGVQQKLIASLALIKPSISIPLMVLTAKCRRLGHVTAVSLYSEPARPHELDDKWGRDIFVPAECTGLFLQAVLINEGEGRRTVICYLFFFLVELLQQVHAVAWWGKNTKLQFIFYYDNVFNVCKIHSPVEFYIYFSLNSLLYFSVFLFLFFLLFRCVLVMACNLKYF